MIKMQLVGISQTLRNGGIMSKLKRPYQMKFYVSENERKLIYKRMHSIGFQRLGSFARKMLLNGVVVNPVITNMTFHTF